VKLLVHARSHKRKRKVEVASRAQSLLLVSLGWAHALPTLTVREHGVPAHQLARLPAHAGSQRRKLKVEMALCVQLQRIVSQVTENAFSTPIVRERGVRVQRLVRTLVHARFQKYKRKVVVVQIARLQLVASLVMGPALQILLVREHGARAHRRVRQLPNAHLRKHKQKVEMVPHAQVQLIAKLVAATVKSHVTVRDIGVRVQQPVRLPTHVFSRRHKLKVVVEHNVQMIQGTAIQVLGRARPIFLVKDHGARAQRRARQLLNVHSCRRKHKAVMVLRVQLQLIVGLGWMRALPTLTV
jgi:hypothetical protein